MNAHLEKLKSFLVQLPIKCDYPEADTLLEMLYHFYTLDNPIDSATIRRHFMMLDHLCQHLSLAENDAVIQTVCTLCSEHERLAFLAGIQIGAQLTEELNSN